VGLLRELGYDGVIIENLYRAVNGCVTLPDLISVDLYQFLSIFNEFCT
jgi:hypothetical protein